MRTFEYRLYPNRIQRQQLMACLMESRAIYQRCDANTPGFSHGDEAPRARRHRHPHHDSHFPVTASSLHAILPAYRRAYGNRRLWSGLDNQESNERGRRSQQTPVCLVRNVRPRNPPPLGVGSGQNEMLATLKAQYEETATFPSKYDLTARFKGRGAFARVCPCARHARRDAC